MSVSYLLEKFAFPKMSDHWSQYFFFHITTHAELQQFKVGTGKTLSSFSKHKHAKILF